MTRLTTTPLAVSADYADALLTARRAKNAIFLLLLLFLLLQITVFFLVRYDVVRLGHTAGGTTELIDMPTTAASGAAPADTQPADAAATTPPAATTARINLGDVLSYTTGIIVYVGMVLSIVLVVIILLIVLTMLVGRLIGVSHATSAFVWAVLLVVLLFPWQRFYSVPESAASVSTISQNDFRFPGVLYTWPELRRDAKFTHENGYNAALKYSRFVGFPILALLILLMVQAKSGRGVKYALGEAEVHVEVNTAET